jgi:hypothetical protein
MSCDQIIAEINQQEATAQLAERRASELRPGYYAYQAASMIPFLGGVFAMADQVTDASHSRELDHLKEEARDAQHRRDYLKGTLSTGCSLLPTTNFLGRPAASVIDRSRGYTYLVMDPN